MGWPQWVIAILLFMQVLGGFVLDGRPRTPWSFSDSVLAAAVYALLFYAGGFWK